MSRLTHVRLLVDDYPACFRFYTDVLGFDSTFGDEESGYADFDTGDVTLALFDREEMLAALEDDGPPARGTDQSALVLRVDSVDESVDRLSADGVEFVAGPADHPEWGVRTAHFRDPDGTLVEINESIPHE